MFEIICIRGIHPGNCNDRPNSKILKLWSYPGLSATVDSVLMYVALCSLHSRSHIAMQSRMAEKFEGLRLCAQSDERDCHAHRISFSVKTAFEGGGFVCRACLTSVLTRRTFLSRHNAATYATLACATHRYGLCYNCDLRHGELRVLFEGLRLLTSAEDKVAYIAVLCSLWHAAFEGGVLVRQVIQRSVRALGSDGRHAVGN
jgi:hypothetical protein